MPVIIFSVTLFQDVTYWSSSVVVRRSSSVFRKQFYILNFLKTTRPIILNILSLNKRNLNCAIYDHNIPAPHREGQWPYSEQISFLGHFSHSQTCNLLLAYFRKSTSTLFYYKIYIYEYYQRFAITVSRSLFAKKIKKIMN